MALQDQNKQLTDLEEDKKEQNNEVVRLKSQENDLATQIKKRENDRRHMQNAISAIIRREVAEARKRAEAVAKQKRADEEERKRRIAEQRKRDLANNKTTTPADEGEAAPLPPTRKRTERPASDLEVTDEGRRMSINFEAGKGSLPWPVNGVPTIRFGSYTIPGTRLKGQSDGLYISVPTGTSVRAVADGEVSSVYDLGGEQAVTVKHGKYFTTYSHLSS
jgi:septal ring factor EnvC (AmiA/AmiB activator)